MIKRVGPKALGARSVLLLTVLIDLTGFAMIFPILPFLSLRFGATPVEGAALVSVYSLMAFFSGPIWGAVSDRIGRRPTLILTLIGAGIGYLALGFADSLVWLFAARAWSGAMAGNIGVVMASMADLSAPEERARAMGHIGAAFGLGFAVGPGLSGLIAGGGDAADFSTPFLVAAALSATAAALATVYLPETRSPGQEQGGPRPSNRILWDSRDKLMLLLMFFLANLVQACSFAIIGFWADIVLGWDQRDVGLMMMAQGGVIAFAQGVGVDPLVRRLGEVGGFLLTQAIMALGCLLLIASASPVVIVGAFTAIIAGQTFSYPLLNALQSRRTAADQQGAGLGLSNGIAALGRVVGPLLGGALLYRAGPAAPYLAVAAIGCLTMAWSIMELRKGRPGVRRSGPQPS